MLIKVAFVLMVLNQNIFVLHRVLHMGCTLTPTFFLIFVDSEGD